MGARFFIASIILALAISAKRGLGELKLTKHQVLPTFSVGGTMMATGIGCVALAERYVPSGVVALLIAAMPLWIAIFRAIDGDRPKFLGGLGVLVGFAGVAFLLKPGSLALPDGVSKATMLLWVSVVMFGNLVWAIGTFISPRLDLPKNYLVLTSYQMFAGGTIMLIMGFITGEDFHQFIHATGRSWLGWAYLATIGSFVAYSAYVWLVAHAPVSLTSTYAYVNPVIAIILGALIQKEPLTGIMVFGAAIVIAGVVLVVSSETLAQRKLQRSL